MEQKSIRVRVRDVDPLNSNVFENGWMYVDYQRGRSDHKYFAPYCSNDCPHPGISMISRVLRVVDCTADDLLASQVRSPQAPSEQHRHKWRLGVEAIRVRAKTEGWKRGDKSRLFYLDRPETFRTPALTKSVYNDTDPDKKLGPSRIPIGFTLTYEQLLTKNSWALEEPPGWTDPSG